MARKKDTKKSAKKPGLVRRIVKAVARKLHLRGDEPEERPETPTRTKERTPTPRAVAAPAGRRAPAEVSRTARVEPIETPERHGAARDERSYEQRRRGGPKTGGATKRAGPHHAGGGKTRGRDAKTKEILDDLAA